MKVGRIKETGKERARVAMGRSGRSRRRRDTASTPGLLMGRVEKYVAIEIPGRRKGVWA
jgi:hypothetical protein